MALLDELETKAKGLSPLDCERLILKLILLKTPPSKRDYISTGGGSCPQCGSEEVESDFCFTGDGEVRCEYLCNTCNSKWDDYLILWHHVITRDGKQTEVTTDETTLIATQNETHNQTNPTNAQ